MLGGILVGTVGWRGIFWVNIPVGLAAISLTALFVPDSQAPRRRAGPTRSGSSWSSSCSARSPTRSSRGRPDGWASPEIIGFFALSVAALRILLAYEPRRPEPLLDFRLFRSVPFAGANLVAICAIAATAGFLFLTTPVPAGRARLQPRCGPA